MFKILLNVVLTGNILYGYYEVHTVNYKILTVI